MNLFSIYKIIGKTAYTSEGLKQGLNFMFGFASIAGRSVDLLLVCIHRLVV